MDAEIFGPSVIEAEGYYTYEAGPSGGNPPYAYQWYVWWHYNSPGNWQDRGTGSSISIFVADGEGDFDVILEVTSADGQFFQERITVQNLAGCNGQDDCPPD